MRAMYSSCSGAIGARLNPQLPETTVVTPWLADELSIGSQKTWAS
jgi:hypothetical protein